MPEKCLLGSLMSHIPQVCNFGQASCGLKRNRRNLGRFFIILIDQDFAKGRIGGDIDHFDGGSAFNPMVASHGAEDIFRDQSISIPQFLTPVYKFEHTGQEGNDFVVVIRVILLGGSVTKSLGAIQNPR